MPSSGGTSGVPITGGVGAGSNIFSPFPYTLLPISRYAKIMGVNPAHFFGLGGYNLNPQIYPFQQTCSAIYHQYSWLDADRVSRYDIAVAIHSAERDIAEYIGYWPAPYWIASERVQYRRPYRREYFGTGVNIRGQINSLPLKFGKVVEVGKREVTLIGTATIAGGELVYSDEDADGLYETATITLPTTETEACALKVYHSDKNGMPHWEIRDARYRQITGGNIVIVMDTFLMVRPELYELPPTELGPVALDYGDLDNLVISVEVYKEYADTSTQASALFYFEPLPADCNDPPCAVTTQDGCLTVRDAENGLVVASPASLDSGTWTAAAWAEDRAPDYVDVWYKSGETSQDYLGGYSCVELSDFWAQTIAWLATARLERPLCSCPNTLALATWLMSDQSRSIGGESFFATPDIITNPFGTRTGEVAAWKRVQKLVRKRARVAVI